MQWLREKCTEARKKPENMAIERGALANVKGKHGTAQDLTRALWERSRKKKGSVASAVEEVAGLWEEPDDEFRWIAFFWPEFTVGLEPLVFKV